MRSLKYLILDLLHRCDDRQYSFSFTAQRSTQLISEEIKLVVDLQKTVRHNAYAVKYFIGEEDGRLCYRSVSNTAKVIYRYIVILY